MKGLKLHGKDLLAVGFPEGRAIGVAINVMLDHHRKMKKEEVLELLARIVADPNVFSTHEHYAPLSDALTGRDRKKEAQHELVPR